MKKWQKIGLTLVGVAVGAVVIKRGISKSEERHYSSYDIHNDEESSESHENNENTTKDKIKSSMAKAVGFAVEHKDEIEGATAVVGLVAGGIGLATKVKEHMRQDYLIKHINDIHDYILNSPSWHEGYNDAFDDCLKEITTAADNGIIFTMDDEINNKVTNFIVKRAEEVAA